LRDSRNEQKLLFGARGISATRKKCFLGFAGFPQRGKSAFWALRDSRNKEKLLFGACGIPATRENCFLVLAGVLQAFPKTF